MHNTCIICSCCMDLPTLFVISSSEKLQNCTTFSHASICSRQISQVYIIVFSHVCGIHLGLKRLFNYKTHFNLINLSLFLGKMQNISEYM